jgi:hypothetical protein
MKRAIICFVLILAALPFPAIAAEQTVTVTKTIPLAEIKTTREHIDFK